MKKEKNSLYYSNTLYLYCKRKKLSRIPKIAPGEIQRKSPAHCSMSRPQVDVATWNSLDSSLSVATSSFFAATSLSCKSLNQWSRHRSDVPTSFVLCSFSVDVATSVSCRDIIVFITFNFMSRPHGDVATSFAFHVFYSGCDLSTLQLISSFPTIFQVTTSK